MGNLATHFTAACFSTLVEQGVLMNDGVPAGIELLKQDTLQIALVDAVPGQGQFPDKFDEHLASTWNRSYKTFGGKPSSFPDSMEGILRNRLAFWYDGNIEFVDYTQNPDLVIYAYDAEDGLKGKAFLPVHDRNDEKYDAQSNKPLISMNIKIIQRFAESNNLTAEEVLGDNLQHELGHTFGVLHPHNSVQWVKEYYPESCTTEELDYFIYEATTGGIMTGGVYNMFDPDHTPNIYDNATSAFLRSFLPQP